jgi:hypothetical protein
VSVVCFKLTVVWNVAGEPSPPRHVKVVSERAGHANVNITLNTYAAYIPNMQADAALRVDAWLRQGVKEATPGLPGGISMGNQPIRERLVQQAVEKHRRSRSSAG